ncbi:NADPH:quinone oxidoreductase family protein [Diaphorobacter sp. HDW4A]|uniref:NADPH:quinone oxidoreductase family protein n=1 Tax=Diaphorobacter sp. HDW4A TaxID=2714924 RepID=UPI00140D04CE|nr:NADPH:quinone oxidoreductase family protein [Diaphorobacter sp. HDW4A]QIL79543.1 NADPH:quinone oxidoreductase family protein [Diaphorobacter sp. HDW4A]
MKALMCTQFGPPSSLQVLEQPLMTAGHGEVVVAVKAAGINFPDTLIIEDRYQIKAPLPFSPGGEFSGVIEEVGADVPDLVAGQEVIGFVGWGAFARQIRVQPPALFAMPAGLPFDVAGSFLMTYGTAYHALRDRAQLMAGETVLVLGAAGGLGIASIELAKALGAKVIAAASSAEKLAVCRAHGADETIDYEHEDLRERLKKITGGRGVDVVCDVVGGRFSEPALRSVGWRGRFLVIGFAGGEIPRIALNLPLLKGCAIVGVFWGDYLKRERSRVEGDIRTLADLYSAGRIRPLISQRFSLEETPAALEAVRQRKAMGKGVVVP